MCIAYPIEHLELIAGQWAKVGTRDCVVGNEQDIEKECYDLDSKSWATLVSTSALDRLSSSTCRSTPNSVGWFSKVEVV